MRIAMLGHKRIPSREGGIEVVVEELSARMVERGHEVTCYNRGGHHVSGKKFDGGKKRKEYRGIRIKTVLTLNVKGIAAATASLSAAFRAAFGRYDVVHFHAEGPAFICWLPKIAGKRVVVTVHGLDHERAKWGRFARSYIMTGEKNAVRFADEMIVLSREAQRYFRDVYARKTTLIPNGVERPAIRSADKIHGLGLEKDSYLLFVGRLVPEKGIQYLIHAFKNLRTDKRLVIAGGESDAAAFAQRLYSEAEGDGRILFTGFVQGTLLEELYSNAYLCCLPSDLEGMPLTLLEAMSYGNCCVVSDIPECTEVTEDRAVIFKRGNVEDLRCKLRQLCDDKEAVERYRRRAAGFICEKYRWEDVVNRTLKLYHGEKG